jgi:WD40 repeat protein
MLHAELCYGMPAIGGRKMFGLFSLDTGTVRVKKSHPTEDFDAFILYDLTHIEFSPNGKMLVTGGNDGHVRLWRIKQK